MGMPKVANMIMLGACLKVTNAVDIESVLHAFLKVLEKENLNLYL